MKLSARSLVLASFLVSMVSIAVSTDPSLAEGAGIDFWNARQYQNQVQNAEATENALSKVDAVILARTHLKSAITHDVINGSVTFEEATKRFEELNREHPASMVPSHLAWSARSDVQAANQLVLYIRASGKPGSKELAAKWERTLAARK